MRSSLSALVRRHLRSSSEKHVTTTAVNNDEITHSRKSRDQSPRREFPSSGFDLVEPTVKLEEEAWSWYSVKHFYPVAIGEIFNNTYQVVAKLGYGTASTTWLCRDLRNHRYVTLKVYASNSPQNAREVAALGHIRSILARPGPSARHTIHANNIRILLDEFRISRPWPSRTNLCLVFDPLSVSLADTRKVVYGGRMDLNMVKCVAFYILQALDFLHRKANLVHADIQEDNIMFAVEHSSEWQHVEEAEMADPSPRKIHKGRTVHSTRFLAELPTPTTPVLCDFGEARFGKDEYAEDAMPDLYRAPEILLRIAWTEKIDIWALGLMLWTLVEGTSLFTNNEGGRRKSAPVHMARMVSVLGPPPQDMLDIPPASKRFFDKEGRLKKGHKVVETSLEAELTALEGEAKASFLRFLRRMLKWDWDDRASAQELLKDPWLVLEAEPESEEGEEER